MLFHALEEEKMASKTVIKSRLEFRRKALEQAQAAYPGIQVSERGRRTVYCKGKGTN